MPQRKPRKSSILHVTEARRGRIRKELKTCMKRLGDGRLFVCETTEVLSDDDWEQDVSGNDIHWNSSDDDETTVKTDNSDDETVEVKTESPEAQEEEEVDTGNDASNEVAPAASGSHATTVVPRRRRCIRREIYFRDFAQPGETWDIAPEPFKEIGRSHHDPGHYVIHNIVDVRYHRGRPEFLVKWFGWSHEFNSWEPQENFDDPSAIQNFWNERQKKVKGRRTK